MANRKITLNQNQKDDNNESNPEKVKQFWNKRNIFIGSMVVAIFISAVSYFAFVGPKLASVGSGREYDTENLADQIEQKQSYKQQLLSLQQNFSRIDQSSIELVGKILPSEKSVPEILSQLETMAKISGVDLLGIKIIQIENNTSKRTMAETNKDQLPLDAIFEKLYQQNQNLNKVQLQMQISARDYSSYKTFLRVLSEHNRLIDVENFNYNTEQDNQNIQARTYYLSEE